ncbi:MarR family winged helix-turn-helix transcriptional regulator [Paracoccaceae bacterium GXU_MW_L88]
MTEQKPEAIDTDAPPFRENVLGELIGYRLRRAYLPVQSAAHQVLAAYNLRVVSFSCLSIIVDNPGIVQSQLADLLQMERPNLVVIIDHLETLELITRTKVQRDRRRYALKATLKGRRLRDKAAKDVRAAEEAVAGGLTVDEQAQLIALLDKLQTGAK